MFQFSNMAANKTTNKNKVEQKVRALECFGGQIVHFGERLEGGCHRRALTLSSAYSGVIDEALRVGNRKWEE